MQVTISPRFQVVIPKDIRQRLNLRPGQRLRVLQRDCGVVFVPILPIQDLEGLFPGIDATIREIHHDVETIRRELIAEGLMTRERGVYRRA